MEDTKQVKVKGETTHHRKMVLLGINDGKYTEYDKHISLVAHISTYVSSILIDNVLKEKCEISCSINVESPDIRDRIIIISNKFPPFVKKQINDISEYIVQSLLPNTEITNVKKQEVKDILSKYLNNEELSEMINKIYENDTDRFDTLASNIIADRQLKSSKRK